MNQVIIFPQASGSIAVMSPSPDCGLTVAQIANKDVPVGVPYLIIDRSDLPVDQTYFAAWTADFSHPDGVGLGEAQENA